MLPRRVWIFALAMVILAVVAWVFHVHSTAQPAINNLVEATNLSYPTQYEEEDNIHIALATPPDRQLLSFTLEARHPTYAIGEDHAQPGRFPAAAPPYAFDQSGIHTLYDDGQTRIDAVRQASFWRPLAMTVRIGAATMPNVHFLQVYRQIPGTDSRPQILVLYTDGNLRLKPLPLPGRPDQLFGTSVLIGPAEGIQRPAADLQTVEYQPDQDTFHLTYRSGGSARLVIQAVDRQITRLHVAVNFKTSAFARVRSMYVADGNSDVDRIRWQDAQGHSHIQPILAFQTAQATEFLFKRDIRSRHNTSAPDLWLGDFLTLCHDGFPSSPINP